MQGSRLTPHVITRSLNFIVIQIWQDCEQNYLIVKIQGPLGSLPATTFNFKRALDRRQLFTSLKENASWLDNALGVYGRGRNCLLFKFIARTGLPNQG